MKSLQKFWKSLDEIPSAKTDALDWRARLQEEWLVASKYLRRSGQIAEAVDCPSPDGDGCPRRIIKRGGSQFRAVCGSLGQQCEPLDLSLDDVRILELNRQDLVAALQQALGATDTGGKSKQQTSNRVAEVGRCSGSRGHSFNVLLALPGPRDPMGFEELQESGLGPDGTVLVVPQPTSLSRPLQTRLLRERHLVLAMSEMLVIGVDGELSGAQPPEALLRAFATVGPALENAGRAMAWQLPAGTQWDQVTCRLTADETLVVRFGGTGRQFDPDQFGLRNTHNHKPSVVWAVLQVLAQTNGHLPIDRVSDRSRLQKRVQALSSALRKAFGIEAHPISWNSRDQSYRAQFVITDERPRRRQA